MIVFEDLFLQSRGAPVIYDGKTVQMVDKIDIEKEAKAMVSFEQVSSPWRQGVNFTTKGYFTVEGEQYPDSIVLWQDTAPKSSEFAITSEDMLLWVKNVWDMGDGVMQSWHSGGAMIVEGEGSARRYLCNDGQMNDDFSDLIFTLDLTV